MENNQLVELKSDDSNFIAVQSLLDQAYRDMETANLDNLMNIYLPDAVIQSPWQSALIGTNAIRVFWSKFFLNSHLYAKPIIDQLQASGDLLFVRGRAIGKIDTKGQSNSVPLNVWFHQIYRKQNGKVFFWRGANGTNP